MTSVLRRYSAIDPRTKFFTVLTDCSGYTLNAQALSSSLMDAISFASSYTQTASFVAPSLLQDLGRAITVYDPTLVGSPHIAVFRQVMLVNGPGIEGINSNIAYVCVWADGNVVYEPATLARVG